VGYFRTDRRHLYLKGKRKYSGGHNERTRDIILATGPVQKAPATNVTVPPDTTPIPSGTELPGTTNTEVKLSFRRTDNSGGCGIDYTNYSKTSETGPWTTVNATTATGPDEANVSSITEETFNLTVSDEGDTKIYYYSVDKNANVEATKDLTVRIQSFELQYAKMPAGTTYKCNITNDWNPTNVGQDATMVFFGETAEIDGETYDVSTITKPNGSTKMYTAADATTKNFTMKRLVTEGKLEGQEEVEVNLTFDPAYVLYAYPLKLGKTWTTETNVTGTVIIAGNEITNSTTAVITGTVTEEVDLTVPYGTFHCLVVEITANLSDLPISVKSTYWMNYTDMPIIPKYASSVSGSDAISIELAEELELKEIRGAGANIVYSALEVTPTSGIAPLEITASAKVENTGDFAGNYNASFMIDDMIKGWSNGTLDAGADTTVSFDYNLTEVGTHNVAIADLTAIEVEVTSPGANIVYSALNVTPTSGVAPLNITASAKVENTGDVAGNYNASFMIDDVILDWSNGTLNAGENTTVSFDYNLTEVGTYNVSIADLDAVAVKVTPIIEYSALDVTPTSGDAPLTITASAKVENKGNATRDYNASFKIDGVIEEWRNGTLNAGENTTISFSHTFPTEGTYEVAIDDLAKTITVTKKEEKHKRGGGGGGGGPSDTDGDGYSDIEEIIMGTDPLEPCDPNPNCVACTALTEEEEITPKPTEKPTATPKPKPKPSVTPTTPAPEEPEETPKPTPGFAAVFAIAGLLAVAYLIQRRKK
jgi:PGF-CTERM protein